MAASKNFAKPNSRAHRRPPEAQRSALVMLPATGCELPVPAMPAGREWTKVERDRWSELWGSPAASCWDESCSGTVALLVAYESRLLSDDGGTAWVAQECRYAAEALGLTPKAMAALGWAISS